LLDQEYFPGKDLTFILWKYKPEDSAEKRRSYKSSITHKFNVCQMRRVSSLLDYGFGFSLTIVSTCSLFCEADLDAF